MDPRTQAGSYQKQAIASKQASKGTEDIDDTRTANGWNHVCVLITSDDREPLVARNSDEMAQKSEMSREVSLKVEDARERDV